MKNNTEHPKHKPINSNKACDLRIRVY